ncbi:unnamed protein product, partial [Callosobruchus maculatus]
NSRGATRDAARNASVVFLVQRGAHLLFYCRVSATPLSLWKTAGKSDENSRKVYLPSKSELRKFFFATLNSLEVLELNFIGVK